MLTSDRVLVDSPVTWLLWLLRYPHGGDSRRHREHGLCLVSLDQHPVLHTQVCIQDQSGPSRVRTSLLSEDYKLKPSWKKSDGNINFSY